MDDIWTMLALSLAMLIGCYLAGVIPLTISLSEEKLKLVTVLGAGLLVGTALAVIIPEGVHAMYSSLEGAHEHVHEHAREVNSNQALNIPEEKDIHKEKPVHEDAAPAPEHSHKNKLEAHSVIGITLVSGFIFMLLVDQIGGNMHAHSSPSEVEAAGHGVNRNKITATLGLVVHAAADGIALGAAITLSQTHITMIVFVAIMLHKAPAAFGLVSFLLHEGLDRLRIRKHLAIFSAAAPLLTIVTYLVLSLQSKENLADIQTTGIAMLFSAGTFLYVATVHVLPEISASQTQHKSADGTVIIREQKGFKMTELIALVLGSVIPVVLALGHKH
ncbi:zinc transporter ZIP9-B [Biomphalaria pfeifferi]|uniref:Zinc transporter ZIP9-B n=1 Tax=Biomphalaria pfeifferi TaxID=112525 RepID=A0AAD8B3U1_BIOPF|nr:zinc transporter ZIP9-B [Biomphalaria pfeifferi]